jgi:dTDP-4-amino-4,6-dideoxygalactose transaminase
MPQVHLPVAKPFYGPEEEQAVARVLRSGWVTQGPEVAALEREFADYCGARHGIAVANCTVALHLSLVAAGIGAGDEVITVSHSFIATANAVRHAGAVPVFVDIKLDDFNIDPVAIEAAITPRTKAILAVHQMGMPARIEAIRAIAERRKLTLIEDAACAIGSEVKSGEGWIKIGKPFGLAACFSFHPRKLLATGDGGMITTDDDAFAARLRQLRQHAMSVNDRARHQSDQVTFESYEEVGFNYRLTDIQAAIGRCQLQRLPGMVAERRVLAAAYQQALGRISGLVAPEDRADTRTNWQSYCVLLPAGADQRGVMQRLLDDGISTRRGVMCIHREPAYANPPESDGVRGPLPVSEAAQDRGMILPMFAGMTAEQARWVASRVDEALAASAPKARAC